MAGHEQHHSDDQPQLIFFDTFSRDVIDSSSHDLIQFRSPVRIHEVRIIPLGARANFPSGDRLGIQFFVNDLSGTSNSCFTPIGSIDYRQNDNILIHVQNRSPTDGLLFRGGYQILTIAVFGVPTDLKPAATAAATSATATTSADQPISSAGSSHTATGIKSDPDALPLTSSVPKIVIKSEDSSDHLSVIGGGGQTPGGLSAERSPISEFSKVSKSCLSTDDLSSPSRSQRSNASTSRNEPMPESSPVSSSGLPEEEEEDVSVSPLNPDLLENISPNASPMDQDEADSISDEDLPLIHEDEDEEEEKEKESGELLEEISSEDEDAGEITAPVEPDDIIVIPDLNDNDAPDHLTFFNPNTASFTPLPAMYDPCRRHRVTLEDESFRADVRRLFRDFDPSLERDFYHLMAHGLVGEKDTRLTKMMDQMQAGVGLQHVTGSQSESAKVRQWKACMKLLTIMVRNPDLVQGVADSGILSHLMVMFRDEQQMNLPFRLMIMSLLDALVDDVTGMKWFLHQDHADAVPGQGERVRETGYQWLLRLFLTGPCSRLLVSMTALLQKCNLFISLSDVTHQVEGDSSAGGKLSNLFNLLTSCGSFMRQQTRLLPVSVVFHRKACRWDARVLFRWMQETGFVSSISDLVDKDSDASAVLTDIVTCITRMPDGMTFLTTNPDRTQEANKIMKCLQQGRDAAHNSTICRLVFEVHANHQILLMHHAAAAAGSPDDSRIEFEQILHSVYMMLFTESGSRALTTVLSDDHMMKLFLSVMGCDRVTSSSSSSHIVAEVMAEILMHVVSHREVDVCRMFLKNGKRIDKIAHEISSSGRISNGKFLLTTMRSWLEPCDILSPTATCRPYSDHYFDRLIKYLRTQMDAASDMLSPHLVNTLRILKDSCVQQQDTNEKSSSKSDFVDLFSVRELAYEYAVMQVYARDGMHALMTMMDFLATRTDVDMLSKDRMFLLVSQVAPAITVVEKILNQLITIRKSEFTDTTPIPILMRMNSLLSSTATVVSSHTCCSQIRERITGILRLYLSLFLVNPVSDKKDTEGTGYDLKSNMWCKMLSEVVRFINSCHMSAPAASGLVILNSLIPGPVFVALGGQDGQGKDQEQDYRSLWCMHLSQLSSEIESLVSRFCSSSNPDIRSQLFNLIIRLCDLSSGQAEVCCNAMLTTLDEIGLTSVSCLMQLMNDLLECPSFRTTISYTLFHGSRSTTLSKLLSLVKDFKDEQVLHLLLEFWSRVTRIDNGIQTTSDLQDQGNLLPVRDVMSHVLTSAFRVMHEQDPGSRLTATSFLRLIHSYSMHESGVMLLRKEMTPEREQQRQAFLSLASLILSHVNDNSSSLCETITTTTTTTTAAGVADESHVSLFIALVQTLQQKGVIDADLRQKVQALVSADSCCSSSSSSLLFAANESPLTDPGQSEASDLTLPKPEPLALLFSRRKVPAERKILTFSQAKSASPVTETIDLLHLSKSLPSFDLIRSLEESLPHSSKGTTVIGKRKQEDQQNYQSFSGKRQMVAPARNSRAFGNRQHQQLGHHHALGNSNNTSAGIRSNDPFRSRAPNTSRPPSMHVDDFVAKQAWDQHQHQQHPHGSSSRSKQQQLHSFANRKQQQNPHQKVNLPSNFRNRNIN